MIPSKDLHDAQRRISKLLLRVFDLNLRATQKHPWLVEVVHLWVRVLGEESL
jgi:hypothetical protein